MVLNAKKLMIYEKTLLTLDLSTTCTGWALFDIDSRKLLSYGKIKPSTKGGVNKLAYPKKQLAKMVDIGNQVYDLIQNYGPSYIVIEEIAGSKNRLGQKTLDGLHFIVAWIIEPYLNWVKYYDVTGLHGWRTNLGLKLSAADKLANKEARKLNKNLSGKQKIPIIGPKHLACRYVNRKFGLTLDVDSTSTDADIADAIAIGDAFLTFRFTELNL